MSVGVVLLLPGVLGTYGDAGNAAVLAARSRWRGLEVDEHVVGWDDPVPEGGDVYVLGGGEDAAQLLAVERLRESRGLRRALDRGAPTLAVCAGLQILGRWFTVADGTRVPGLGVLDLATEPGRGPRRIGDVTADPLLAGLDDPLVGFENHGGLTTLGPDARPLARVRGAAAGNGTRDRSEGAVGGSVIGTYLHGPVLARNPALADLLLSRALGDLPPLEVPEGLPSSTTRRLGGRFRDALSAAVPRRAGA